MWLKYYHTNCHILGCLCQCSESTYRGLTDGQTHTNKQTKLILTAHGQITLFSFGSLCTKHARLFLQPALS